MGLVDRAVGGDRRALARLASIVERGGDDADAVYGALPSPPAESQVIGLTGPPGAGKSSIINRLVEAYLQRGDHVAVLLVDPSSPFTGGAVLGDRVRMDEWPDDRVFLRSLASRGWEGGLAPSTAFMVRLFAAVGFGRVIVESVGVGQDAVDIRELVDTVVVVQVPNLGDTVQTLKAGILEIADLYVVNKSDLPGSQTAVRELKALLRLVEVDPIRYSSKVLAVSASQSIGFEEVIAELDEHRAWLERQVTTRRSAERQASWYLRKRLQADVWLLSATDGFRDIAADMISGATGATEAARRVRELLAGP